MDFTKLEGCARARVSEYTHYLKLRASFRTSSTFALKDDISYKVYSYNTLIFQIFADDVVYWNGEKHSKTTTKLQNALREVFSREIARFEQKAISGNSKVLRGTFKEQQKSLRASKVIQGFNF